MLGVSRRLIQSHTLLAVQWTRRSERFVPGSVLATDDSGTSERSDPDPLTFENQCG